MKKSFKLLITIICVVCTSSAYAQWTTSGSNVSLTTTTNNVIVGPVPATPANLHVNSANTTTKLTVENTSGGSNTYTGIQFKGTSSYDVYSNVVYQNCGSAFHISPTAGGQGIHLGGGMIYFSSNPTFYCTTSGPTYSKYYFDGATSIGTTKSANGYKLSVGGSIMCEELVVKLQANWPDFVFSPQYKLRPLSEVKTFIAENKHLPDVPAACEVEKNGVATGEMLTIQMKKIEELTLYLIQMQEENEALKKRIEALEVK